MRTTITAIAATLAIGLSFYALVEGSGNGVLAFTKAAKGESSPAASDAAQDDLRVRSLSIVGDDGSVVLRLGTGDDGKPRMWVYDDNGRVACVLGVGASGTAGFEFYDSQGQVSCLLFALPSGEAGLQLVGPNDVPVAEFGRTSLGAPVLAFRDLKDKVRMGMTVEGGASTLVIGDSNENERIVHQVDESDVARIKINDGEGKTIYHWTSEDK